MGLVRLSLGIFQNWHNYTNHPWHTIETPLSLLLPLSLTLISMTTIELPQPSSKPPKPPIENRLWKLFVTLFNIYFLWNRCMPEISIFVLRRKRKFSFKKLQSLQKILLGQSCRIYCNLFFVYLSFLKSTSEAWAWCFLELNDRNEAGILTARKDLDYIGREELLEALKRVSCAFPILSLLLGKIKPFPYIMCN